MSPARAPRARHGLGVLIALNSMVQIIGLFAGAMISLITVAAIARELGPATFGHYAAALAFVAIPVNLADAGLSTYVLREISQAPERTEPAMRASLPVRLVTSAVLVAAAAGLAQVIPLDHETQVAVAIGSVGAFLTLLGFALLPVLMAQLRMGWSVVANLAGRVLTLVLTLVVLASGGGLEEVLWAYVAGAGATLAIDLVAVARLVSLRPVADVAYWKRLLMGSIPLGIGHGLGQIYYKIDTVLLALLRPSREVGLYAAAFKFVEFTQLVVSSLMNSIFAPLSRFAATNDRRLRPLVQRVFEVLLFASLPLSILAAVNARDLVILVGGEEFADAAIALQILAAYPVLSFLTTFIERGIIAVGRDRLLASWSAGFLGVNLAANLVLIPLFGYRAAAVAAVGTEAVGLVVGALMFVRLLGFLPRLRGAGTILLAAIGMAAILVLVPGPALAVSAVAVAAYAAALLLVPGTIRALAGELLQGFRRTRLAPAP